MAFLSTDNKQNTTQQQGTNQTGSLGSQLNTGSSVAPLSGGGSNSVSSSTGSGPSGPGGGGSGWTNIQSYLTANQGNTGSSDTLAKNVGSAFDQDKQNISNQSQNTENQADQFVQNHYVAPDQASSLISQAANLYQYGGSGQSADYNNDVNQVKNQFAQYGGPASGSFSTGLSGQTQQYGQALGNDDQLNTLMNQFYQNKAGQNFNQGQSDLQNLLQQNDPNFQAERQNLATQYGNLNNYLNQTVSGTNAYLNADQNKYAQNQTDLRNYLTGQQSNFQNDINNAVSAWNSAENQDRTQALGSENAAIQNYINSGQLQQYLNSSPSAQYATDYQNAITNGQGPQYFNTAQNSSLYSQNYLTPQQLVDQTTVGGVDNQRNSFNTIADILGIGGNIGRGQLVNNHSNFDSTALQNEINRGVQQWLQNTGRA